MNKIVRHSCFETNSSSAHSITIEDGVDFETIVDWKDTGVYEVDLSQYQFGWKMEDFTDVETKLAYLLTDIFNYTNSPLCEKLCRLTKEVFAEHTGLTLKVNQAEKDSYDNYIDHQSVGTATSAVHGKTDEQIKANIKNFVFNRKSVLHTDNDNH